MTLQLVSC